MTRHLTTRAEEEERRVRVVGPRITAALRLPFPYQSPQDIISLLRLIPYFVSMDCSFNSYDCIKI